MLVAFTLFHVLLSLVGLAAGFVFTADLLASRERAKWTQSFLVTTIATSVTGFFFPAEKILPSHVVGAISLIVLAVTLYSRGRFVADGTLRKTYVATSLFALYLNVFVLVVQMFLKIAPLKSLAPTQTEPAFAIAQGLVLLAFTVIGLRALKQFHPDQHRTLVGVSA